MSRSTSRAHDDVNDDNDGTNDTTRNAGSDSADDAVTPDDHERTFAALAPVPGRGFAGTWWGRAWLKALEDTALDGQQLKQGRRRAREGAVGAVSVRPGRITAVVQDRDGTAQRSDVLWQPLSEEEWDRFLDMAVDRAGHIAALLDREMPPHLVEDAAGAGVELLPGIGDLEPECGCEAWDHCPHSAALCYQMARLLDQDPFVLLLMRGCGERRLLDELHVRSVARAARTSPGRGASRNRPTRRQACRVYRPRRPSRQATGCRPFPLPRRCRRHRDSLRPSTRKARRRRAWTRTPWSSWPPTRRHGPCVCWPTRCHLITDNSHWKRI